MAIITIIADKKTSNYDAIKLVQKFIENNYPPKFYKYEFEQIIEQKDNNYAINEYQIGPLCDVTFYVEKIDEK